MTVATIAHVVVDDKGVARITGRDTRVIEIVLDKIAYDWTPEQIREQHPHLSLAEIHSAFVFYYDHQAQLDAQIKRELAEVDAIRARAGESPVHVRLRKAGKLK
ncbi:MAG: uncharacterized protein JWL69_5215 [Phycisphaerales bacterium]|nr:uncharacterized protein [Phycisphaerales bacterium]